MNNTKWELAGYDDLARNFFAAKPKEVDGLANTSAFYYRQWMLKKIFSRFEILNIPKSWEFDYLLENIFINGMVCICDTSLGVLPLQCGVTGINVFNHPTECQIANPILGSFTKKIDEDCVLVKLQYDFKGCGWMLDRYAALLSMCDSATAVNLMNSKVTFIGLASSKAQAASMQKMYDEIACGKPAVFVKGDNINSENFFFNNVKNSFVADDIQLLKRKIINEFLSDIGINNTNLDKRERLTDDEVSANNEEVLYSVQHWLENLKEGFDKVNKMFNLNIEVKLKDLSGGVKNEFAELS